MKTNLDGLKAEIEQYVQKAGMTMFYGHSRALDSVPVVRWDCDQYPDYKEFIEVARAAGAKLVVFHQRKFSVDQIEDALEQLEACDLPREEYREFERRLNHLKTYDGKVCAIELSFDSQNRAFLFDLRTEWYKVLSDVLDEIEVFTLGEDDDDTPMSGYFSRN